MNFSLCRHCRTCLKLVLKWSSTNLRVVKIRYVSNVKMSLIWNQVATYTVYPPSKPLPCEGPSVCGHFTTLLFHVRPSPSSLGLVSNMNKRCSISGSMWPLDNDRHTAALSTYCREPRGEKSTLPLRTQLQWDKS